MATTATRPAPALTERLKAMAAQAAELTEYVPAPDPDDDWERFRRAELRQRLVSAGVPLIEIPGYDADGNALTERDILSDLAYEIEVYLRGLSIAQLVCLTYGHRWPELIPIPGMKVPKGFRILPSPEIRGIYLVTENCTRKISIKNGRRADVQTCGTVRKSQTLPGDIPGLYDRKHARQYAYDNDVWEVRPEGSRLTRIDFWNETIRRMGRVLLPAEYEGTEA
jgi:hypothetical protein